MNKKLGNNLLFAVFSADAVKQFVFSDLGHQSMNEFN